MTPYRFRPAVEAAPDPDGDGYLVGPGRVYMPREMFEALLEPDGEGTPGGHPGSAPPPTW